MCPSYLATREEKHSTRGRANALRLAMTGQLGEPGSPTTTCTTCSTCASSARRARPSARSAWTWRGSRASSSPATGSGTACRCGRASSATCTRWRSGAAASRRCRTSSRGSAPGALDQRAAARHRPPAHAAVASRARRSRGGSTTHRHPRHQPSSRQPAPAWCSSPTPSRTTTIPRSAWPRSTCSTAPASASRLAPHGCCGRPLISQGLLDEARDAAQANADALFDAASRGERDRLPRAELPVGGPRGRAGAAARRGAAQGAGRRRCVRAVRGATSSGNGRRAALALDLAARAVDACCCTATATRSRWACCRRRARCSRAFPSCTVVDLDAGCCGMAGSFGYATRALRCLAARSASASCCRPRAR